MNDSGGSGDGDGGDGGGDGDGTGGGSQTAAWQPAAAAGETAALANVRALQ